MSHDSVLRVLIVDDEAPARERLRALLSDIADVEVVGEAVDGIGTLASVERLQPDVVLLDVRMPGMDGLEAATHLALMAPPPAVIFTTAYQQHALAAFDARALDYLLKPVRAGRLE
jgi:two-component system response regulator AlgR